MSNITILKTDEKLFAELIPNASLTHYYKTKDNSLRIAFFNNNEFIAIETPKSNNTFKTLVLDVDKNNVYNLTETKNIYKKNNIAYVIYKGTRNV
jgi:hypothetical protein